MEQTKGQVFTKWALRLLTLIGGILVTEQWISGEQLASIQGLAGMALGGGGLTAGAVIYALNTIIPKETAKNIVNKVGADKVNKVFDTIDSVLSKVAELESIIVKLEEQLELERQAKIELGVYDSVSQDLKDKLNV